MPFGMEKPEWYGYPVVKKFEDIIIRFDSMHERDRHRDRQTDTRMTAKGPFIAMQLNSARRRVELSCVAINGP